MSSFTCKRYRRSSPDVPVDTMTVQADDAGQAQNMISRNFRSGIAPMDWNRDFVTLEDEAGQEVARWETGAL